MEAPAFVRQSASAVGGSAGLSGPRKDCHFDFGFSHGGFGLIKQAQSFRAKRPAPLYLREAPGRAVEESLFDLTGNGQCPWREPCPKHQRLEIWLFLRSNSPDLHTHRGRFFFTPTTTCAISTPRVKIFSVSSDSAKSPIAGVFVSSSHRRRHSASPTKEGGKVRRFFVSARAFQRTSTHALEESLLELPDRKPPPHYRAAVIPSEASRAFAFARSGGTRSREISLRFNQ